MRLTLTKDWKVLWVVVPTTSWLGALQINLKRARMIGASTYIAPHWKTRLHRHGPAYRPCTLILQVNSQLSHTSKQQRDTRNKIVDNYVELPLVIGGVQKQAVYLAGSEQARVYAPFPCGPLCIGSSCGCQSIQHLPHFSAGLYGQQNKQADRIL